MNLNFDPYPLNPQAGLKLVTTSSVSLVGQLFPCVSRCQIFSGALEFQMPKLTQMVSACYYCGSQ